METLRISCPHCGLSREVPRDRLPAKAVKATCPRCKMTFDFDPAAAAKASRDAAAPPPPPHPGAPTAPRQPVSSPAPSTPPPPPPVQPPYRASAAPLPPRRPPALQAQTLPAGGGLMGIGELLSATWSTFQKRFGTLFALYLLSILMGVIPAMLCTGLGVLLTMVLPFGKAGVTALGGVLGAIGATVGFCWGIGALFAASLDDDLDVRRSLERARPLILSFMWVFIISAFVVTGGYMLLIVPGIIFTVWFLLAPYVILDSDTRGMSALLKSRAMTKGRWFDVFLRLVVIWACSALIGAIPFLGPLLVLVAAPFVMLYQALLYKDLQRVSEPVIFDCSFGSLARWPAVALVGYVALPALLLGVFGASLLGQLKQLKTFGKERPVTVRITPGGEGGQSIPAEGEWRVIPIPSDSGTTPVLPTPQPGSAPTEISRFSAGSYEKTPDNLHVFIYCVNYTGRVLANGVELKQLEGKPDMQYNYNMSGDRMRFGRNSIEVEYVPLSVQGDMLKPQMHIKISSTGGDRKVLGEWRIEETVAGRKSFDLDVPQ